MNGYIKKVFGNSAWVISSKIINIVVGLLVSVLVTRYLGADQKGQMASASAISGFWGFIASFGLFDIMVSKFAKERDKSAEIAASGMKLMFMSGILSFVLAIVSGLILKVTTNVLIYVAISAAVYIFQCLSIYEYWFYSNSNSKKFAIAQSIVHIIFLLLRLAGVPLKVDLIYFVLLAALETIITYCSLYVCYRRTGCFFVGAFKPNKDITSELFKTAIPMIAMGFATTIYMKVDQIMVGKLMGNMELGFYSVAVNLAEYWYFVPATLYGSFLPMLTKSSEHKEEFKNRLQQFADIMAGIGFFAAFGVLIFGKWGIGILYGDEFSKSAEILMVYIWSGLFTCIGYSGQAYYIIHKDTKTVMWINIAGACLNFILNLILISVLGSVGAALATLLEYAIVLLGQMILLRKKYGELYIIQLKSLFPFLRIGKYIKSLRGR